MKSSKIKITAITIFFTLFVSNIVAILMVVASGNKVSRLQKDKNYILSENQEKRDHLVKFSSLKDLSEKAGNLGYLKAAKLYINSVDSVASAR